ncbi:mesoderm posterior protein 1-like [Pseudophryne corroboree]|uniref:mesoderm posterior protein 1-like n=1 Tax=Pseudophryne corroboree TaxID=495146 RepID=UPI003081773A
MDLSLAELQFKENMSLPHCTTLQQWGYPDSEGYSSLSPTSSTDSFSFSPPYQSCAFPEGTYSSIQAALCQAQVLQSRQKEVPAKKSHKIRNRTVPNQRQSASEREKMRMRNLSTATQHLRRYLPAAVAPVGKTLTKIETLRLTIRYIAHLSEVLGLDDETLVNRREEQLRRTTCPVGLSCCQGNLHETCSVTGAQIPETFPHYSSSPAIFPEQTRLGAMDTNFSLAEMQSPKFTEQGLAEQGARFSPCFMSSTPAISDMKEELATQPPISPDLGFSQDVIDDMWDELEKKDLWRTFETCESNQIQDFC